jgi:hypothetical protein
MITLDSIDSQMIANNMMPSEPVHPGLLLKEEIEYRGCSQKQLAKQTGVSYFLKSGRLLQRFEF